MKVIAHLVKHWRSALVGCIALTGCTSQDPPPTSPSSEYSTTVGPQGAVVQGPDQVTLAVPAGAITDTTVVSIARSSSGAPDLVGITLLSPIYAITPQGVRFKSNALLSVPYDVNKLPAGAQAFVLRGEPDGTWHVQAIEGTQPGVAQVNVSNLSWYAVGACSPTGGGSFGFGSMDCPGGYQLRLEMLDGNGQPVPVPRDAQGRALPFTPEITAPTNVVLRLTWTRPTGVDRDDDVQLAGGGPGFGIGPLLAWTANQQTFTQNVTLQIDPANVPNAANPTGVVRRFQATATYCFTGSTTSGGPVRRVPWSFDIDVAFRIRDIGISGTAPAIVTQPGVAVRYRSNRLARYGASFTVEATGTPPLSYQWFFNGQPLANRAAGVFTSGIAGATTSTLLMDNVQLQDEGYYTVEVSNGQGPNAVSADGFLRVYPQEEVEGSAFAARSPHIASDSSGNVLAVWKQTDGTRDEIWSNRHAAAGEWELPQRLSANSVNLSDADTPRVAFDRNGNALAIWSQLNTTTQRSHIWINRYFDGAWSDAPQRIEVSVSGDAAAAQLAFDANGNALIVWQQFDDNQSQIWACRYTPNNLCEILDRIDALNGGAATSPQIMVDSAGNALAVWQQLNGTRADVWANRYVAGDDWSGAQLLETEDAGDAASPQISRDANGNAFVVWEQSDGTRFNIWAKRYSAINGWQSAQLIETDDVGDAHLPQVVIDAAGNALAVWQQAYGSGSDATGMTVPLHLIWANRFVVASGEWQSARRFSTNGTSNENQNAFAPQVAISANGDAVLVWTTEFSQNSVRYKSVIGQRNKPENLESLSFGVTQPLSIGSNFIRTTSPQISIDANGNALAVWEEKFNVSNPNIWSNVVP